MSDDPDAPDVGPNPRWLYRRPSSVIGYGPPRRPDQSDQEWFHHEAVAITQQVDGRWRLVGPVPRDWHGPGQARANGTREECIHGCLLVEVLALAHDMIMRPEKLAEPQEKE